MNTPWTASTDGEWWDVVGQDGATIARFRGNQHESLARLIAAAPDLLEAGAALDSAMDMQEKRETRTFHLSMPAARHVWDEARAKWAAAIAKATGDA